METRRRFPSFETAWPHALFALLLLVVFFIARGVTADLEWPCEEDFWRDMGFARTILDGHYGEDPFYLGEVVWYPPLVHSLLALITKLSGSALNIVSVRSGAYLDLLAPVAFYLLALRWAGPTTAIFAGLAFILLGPHNLCSCDGDATYSPWLWPDNFAQGVGYLALFTALGWREKPTRLRAAATGIMLGLAALAHAAPAVMAAGIITFLVTSDVVRAFRNGEAERARTQLLGLGLAAAVAIVVTLPFSLQLMLRYHGAVRNWEGVGWQHEHHHLASFRLLLDDQISIRGIAAVLGLGFSISARSSAHPRLLAPVWAVLAIIGIGWGYLHDWAIEHGESLPILFSSWHFALYLQAAESLLAGLGLAAACSLLVAHRREWLAALSAAVAVLLAVLGLSQYATRADFVRNRSHALWRARREHPDLTNWILEHTSSNDVFLASARQAMFTVAPAARKVLVLPRDFANPYVDPEPREALQRALIEAPPEEFRRLARENGIRFVILEPGGVLDGEGPLRAARAHPPWLRQVHSAIRDGPDLPHYTALHPSGEACPWALTDCDPAGGRVRIFEIVDEDPGPR